jgi:hypothetical protein
MLGENEYKNHDRYSLNIEKIRTLLDHNRAQPTNYCTASVVEPAIRVSEYFVS